MDPERLCGGSNGSVLSEGILNSKVEMETKEDWGNGAVLEGYALLPK